MQSHSRIFTDKYLDIKSAPLEKILSSGLEEKKALIKDWQEGIRSGRILQAKEEQLQSSFLRVFFGDVLGYVHSKGASVWNLEEEQKTLADSTKMDGALGFFTLDSNGKTAADIRAVIELKDARTDLDKPQTRKNDRRTPVQQAFDYAGAMGGTCRWVIVSNFLEIRLYFHNDRTRYESFDIPGLDRDMKRFLFLLHKDRLTAQQGESFTDTLYRERQEQEKNISRQFYADYRHARLSLFHHIREQNADISESLLLTKTQKLLDRLLFVCFCEDFGILPYFTFRGLLKNVKEDRFNRSDSKIYERVKALFDAINSGYPEENINKFNGGLFADDEILDGLMIKDAVLEHVIELERYDFASDLNVNILGHIFEQSVTDMEELKAEIAGQSFDRKKGKRKKEGIFYTPEYITRYIVDEAVGGWLADRKSEIGFDRLPELTQTDYDSVKKSSRKKKSSKNIDLHIQALEAYREKLRNIRVLDPACGSGAFLNQVFDFLYKEGQKVNSEIAMLKRGQREVFDLDKDILTNNIFGVDLNDESAEITKLSLWLKTANRNKELTTLDANIKCGNSLIDDPAVAGEKAFDWNAEFPEIMKNGGFDVVVGNPPYVQSHSLSENQKDFFYKNYETAEYQINTFGLFIEKSIKILKGKAYYSLIIPNYWLSTRYDEKLRKFVFIKNHATEVLNVFNVFEDATVDTLIILGKKNSSIQLPHKTRVLTINPMIKTIPERLKSLDSRKWHFENNVIFDDENGDTKISFDKKIEMKGKYQLSDFFEFKFGMKPYEEGKGKPPQTRDMINKKIYEANSRIDESYEPLLRLRNVKRYSVTWENEWIKFGSNLAAPRTRDIFEGSRILAGRIISGRKIDGTVLDETFINNTDLINIIAKNNSVNVKAFAAVILSNFCAAVLKKQNVNLNRNVFPKINAETLKSFPVPELDETACAVLAGKVDIMLTQNKALQHLKKDFLTFLKNELKPVKITSKMENWPDLNWDEFRTELKKAKVNFDNLNLKDRRQWQDYFLEHQEKALEIKGIIDKTDKEIDKMVYDLYGLTKEEIRIVEGTAPEQETNPRD